jgi:hypothetical protein
MNSRPSSLLRNCGRPVCEHGWCDGEAGRPSVSSRICERGPTKPALRPCRKMNGRSFSTSSKPPPRSPRQSITRHSVMDGEVPKQPLTNRIAWAYLFQHPCQASGASQTQIPRVSYCPDWERGLPQNTPRPPSPSSDEHTAYHAVPNTPLAFQCVPGANTNEFRLFKYPSRGHAHEWRASEARLLATPERQFDRRKIPLDTAKAWKAARG